MADPTQDKIDLLKTEVERTKGVMASAKALIVGLLAQIEAAKDDPEQIQAIIDDARAATDDLASAIPANP